jgi:hypothetical protein
MVFVWQHGYMLWAQATEAVNPIQADRKLAELALTRLH